MKVFIAYTFIVSLVVTGNLLLKLGANISSHTGAWYQELINWKVIGGFTCFGLAGIIYLLVLTKLPLNMAQSFVSIQFVAVVLASYFLLGEPIGVMRWTGIALITLGVFIIGRYS